MEHDFGGGLRSRFVQLENLTEEEVKKNYDFILIGPTVTDERYKEIEGLLKSKSAKTKIIRIDYDPQSTYDKHHITRIPISGGLVRTIFGELESVGTAKEKAKEYAKIMEKRILHALRKSLKNPHFVLPDDFLLQQHAERAMNPAMAVLGLDHTQTVTGGIDLTSDKALIVRNSGQGIQFHIDPVQLRQLENAPGLLIGSMTIQPLKSLSVFLGY